MNRKELASTLSERVESLGKGEALEVVREIESIIAEELAQGNAVSLSGFGKFYALEREEREGRNPQTGETITIAASKAPKFKAGVVLKDKVNA